MKSPLHRRSIRLPGYDYSQPGGYFVTICTRDRECVLGEVADGQVRLSPLGQIAAGCLADLPSHFQDVELDEWVVMPNHIHAILVIHGRGTAHLPRPQVLGAVPLPTPIRPSRGRRGCN